MGDALKADKGPGGDEDDPEDLGKGIPVREKGRGKIHAGGASADERSDEADSNPGREDQHHRDHGVRRDILAPHTEQGNQQDDGKGQQDLAQVDRIVEDGIEVSETEGIAQEIMGKERQAGRVRPEHGDIGQAQEPEDQEGAVIAEDVFDHRIEAAGVRIARGHIVIVPGNQQHQEHAGRQADDAARRAGLGQVARSGHHQGAPADARANSQRPGGRRRKIGRQPLCAGIIRFFCGHRNPSRQVCGSGSLKEIVTFFPD